MSPSWRSTPQGDTRSSGRAADWSERPPANLPVACGRCGPLRLSRWDGATRLVPQWHSRQCPMCGDSLVVKPQGGRLPARVTGDDLLDL